MKSSLANAVNKGGVNSNDSNEMTGAGSSDDMAALLLRRWLSIKLDPNRSKNEIELAVLGNSSACKKNKSCLFVRLYNGNLGFPLGLGLAMTGY